MKNFKDKIYVLTTNGFNFDQQLRFQYIYKKHRGSITDAEILERINKDAALTLQIESKKFEEGVELARETIDSGKAYEKLKQFVKENNALEKLEEFN